MDVLSHMTIGSVSQVLEWKIDLVKDVFIGWLDWVWYYGS